MKEVLRQWWWWAAGLALGLPNALRRRALGYGHPRPRAGADREADILYAAQTVRAFSESLRAAGAGDEPFLGKRVLEFGPGPDLFSGVATLLLGAREYVALDRFPLLRVSDHRFAVERLTAALPSVPAERTADVRALLEEDRTSDGRFAYRQGAAETAREALTGAYDIVMSQAAFEHFFDPRRVFDEIAALLAPGGYTVHEIDFQTHNRFLRDPDPLNILRYPESLYRAFVAFPGAPNRLRASEYVRFAREAGLSDVRLEIVTKYPSDRAETDRPYLARVFREATPADLTTLSARLIARKPV